MTDPLPTNLEEAIQALDQLLNEEDKKALNEEDPEKAALQVHHSLGRHLRNTWNLWSDKSPLKANLVKNHGILHPDDMSHFIITSYLRVKYPTLWEHIQQD